MKTTTHTPELQPMETQNYAARNPIQTQRPPGAQVASVHELVRYQDGSIVRREIVKRPAGSVTIFPFDEGHELSEHTASFDALVQVVEGETEKQFTL